MKEIYLSSVIKRFKEYKSYGDRTIQRLDEKQLHWQPGTESNSIAVIIQHMHGNMLSRWTNFLTEDGEKQWRKRDDEFEVHALSKDKVLTMWEEGWKLPLATLQSLSTDDLDKTITIRSQSLPVPDAINRQLAHYAYHVGQMVFIGKMFLNEEWESLSIPRNKSADYNKKMNHK
jgi:hypothetical protein